MDNEFDKQASKILRENVDDINVDDISGERWSQEWDFSKFSDPLKQDIADFEQNLSGGGDGIDTNVIELKDIVDEIVGANVLDDDVKEQAIGYLKQRAEASHLAEEELYGEEGIFSGVEEDKDFHDEQRDQDPYRHKGLSDFDAEQRDQDPYRHTPDR